MAEKTNAFGPDFHVVLGDVILEWWRMRKEKKKTGKESQFGFAFKDSDSL